MKARASAAVKDFWGFLEEFWGGLSERFLGELSSWAVEAGWVLADFMVLL